MAETVVVAVVNEAVEVAPGAPAVICETGLGRPVEAIEAEVTSLIPLVRPAMLATQNHSGG